MFLNWNPFGCLVFFIKQRHVSQVLTLFTIFSLSALKGMFPKSEHFWQCCSSCQTNGLIYRFIECIVCLVRKVYFRNLDTFCCLVRLVKPTGFSLNTGIFFVVSLEWFTVSSFDTFAVLFVLHIRA